MASQSTSSQKWDKFKPRFRHKTLRPPEPFNDSIVAPGSPRKRGGFELKSFFRRPHPPPPSGSIPSQSSNNNLVPTAPNVLDASSPLPIPILSLSSSDNVTTASPIAPDTPPLQVVPQKAFVRSKIFEKDVAVLSITYIIAENSELKKLIRLIVGIRDRDEDNRLTSVLETCARFSVQLAAATKAHPAETANAITEFIKTVENLSLESDVDTVTHMVNGEIAKIKSSHPLFARSPDVGTWDPLSKMLTTIGASITVLSIVKDASNVIPVPWVQSLIGGVVNLLNAVVQTRSNYDEMRQIAATAGEFVISCAVACSGYTTELPQELKRALQNFTKTLEVIAKDCEEWSQFNPIWRFLQQTVHKNTLQGSRASLNMAIEQFQTESQIHVQLNLKDLDEKFDYASLNSLPSHPYYVPNEYLSGSRDDALEYISNWIDKPNEAVLWIYGAAGLGKSTTGQQVVQILQKGSRLAGGVFLTNLRKESSETVIQMISKQLGERHPRAIPNIAEAARKLNGPHHPLSDYFTRYIVEPICQLKYPHQLVVVVDGLEEWTNHESFLAELAHIPFPSPVKFILTSRHSHSVERILNKITAQSYLLPPVSSQIVEQYFNHHFQKIDWRSRKPDQLIISRLAALANGLLIWAATVCSLLSHEFDQRYPHQIVDQILSSEEKVGTRSGNQLERLYREAVVALFPTPDVREKLRDFLGAMMVLQEPMPLRDFARLLPWDVPGQLVSDRPAEEIQRRLAAFQTRGEINSATICPAIQQFHISFLEYMAPTSTEHNGPPIAISTANAHLMLADRCLKLIFSEFLPSYRGKACAYSDLRGVEPYAIRYWPLHLSNGTSRLLLAPSVTGTLTAISDEDMQHWATLFLPCVAARFRDEYESLDNIPKHEQLLKLAEIIGKEDASTLSYRLYCLETAVRLQPIDVKIWIALGNTYDKLYKHGRYNKDLDEEISVLRHAQQLVLQKSAGEESLHGIDADIVRDNEGQTNAGGTDTLGDVLLSLAFALSTRFQQRGAQIDLDEAISCNRNALILRPAPHPNRPFLLNDLGDALLHCFEQRGTSSSLDEAISLYREALLLHPVPHPDRSWSLKNLASALQFRFHEQDALSDLDEEISLCREVLSLQPAAHPDRSSSLNDLADALFTRFGRQGTPNDLDEAISFNQEALELGLTTHPNITSSLDDLAGVLLTRFRQLGEPSDLEKAISFYQKALLLCPAPHPGRPLALFSLANALSTRFGQSSAAHDLDEAISLYREAVLLQPAPHRGRPLALDSLANALKTRFGQSSATHDLDEAIYLYREAVVLQPAPQPAHPRAIGSLALALETRFGQSSTSSTHDLDEAISLHRETLVFWPAPHPDRPLGLDRLANALETRFDQSSAPCDLDKAISLYREAVLLQPAPHPDRPQALRSLAHALETRFGQSSAPCDLDEAIYLYREAVQLLQPAPHPAHPRAIGSLALALETRFGQSSTSSTHDLDEAISLHREVLVFWPAPHPDRPLGLGSLANALETRFGQSSAPCDLDEAISLYREAVLLQPAPHLDRPLALDSLADALSTRFGQSSAAHDLDEAISLYREAVLLQPAPHPYRPLALESLADALSTRFGQSSTPCDLDEAISLYREAILPLPAPHPARLRAIGSLALALSTRFDQSSAAHDLDEAISLYREAFLLLPAPHPARLRALDSLADALLTRFGQSSAPCDLDEAISLYREAVLLLPAPHPARPRAIGSLALALETRFGQSSTSSTHDLDEAISLHRETLVFLPVPHPDRPLGLGSLADALSTRFGKSSAPCDLDEAISLYREAVLLLPAPHPARLRAIGSLALALKTRFGQSSATHDLDEAIPLYREAVLLWPAPDSGRPLALCSLAYALEKRFDQSNAIHDLDEATLMFREVLVLCPAPHPRRRLALRILADALQKRFEKQGTMIDRDEADSLRQEAEALKLQTSPHPDHSAPQ